KGLGLVEASAEQSPPSSKADPPSASSKAGEAISAASAVASMPSVGAPPSTSAGAVLEPSVRPKASWTNAGVVVSMVTAAAVVVAVGLFFMKDPSPRPSGSAPEGSAPPAGPSHDVVAGAPPSVASAPPSAAPAPSAA